MIESNNYTFVGYCLQGHETWEGDGSFAQRVAAKPGYALLFLTALVELAVRGILHMITFGMLDQKNSLQEAYEVSTICLKSLLWGTPAKHDVESPPPSPLSPQISDTEIEILPEKPSQGISKKKLFIIALVFSTVIYFGFPIFSTMVEDLWYRGRETLLQCVERVGDPQESLYTAKRILNCFPNATLSTCKGLQKTYRQMAILLHPDKNRLAANASVYLNQAKVLFSVNC